MTDDAPLADNPEDAALDALILHILATAAIGDEPEPIALDDPAILTDEELRAMEAAVTTGEFILTDEDRAAMESLGTSEELIARCQMIVDERERQREQERRP